ncbi:MAG: HipA domain-containing protein [Bacteroidetes bacterium]|nr:HipA domain-containing protein [Bacteroidota bacterium]
MTRKLRGKLRFNICIKNTDDHLRNHGFLLGKNGWQLSPAFDINPNPTGTGLTLNISENDNSLNLELALEVATYFRINNLDAKEIITKVQKNVRNWNKVASKYRIPKIQQELMAAAFERSG